MLVCQQLAKHFGTLQVLQSLSFTIQPGEVAGLVGQSGAGKSVLVRILAGLDQPDSGQISLQGMPITSTTTARRAGIAIIHQQAALVEHMDITSAIFLGHEREHRLRWPWAQRVDQQDLDRRAQAIVAELGLDIASVHEKVGNLSGEQRQMLMLAHAVAAQPRFVVVDDPTGPMRPEHQQTLLHLIGTWQQQGCGVLFCSQNLDHLFAVTNRILVLRHGWLVADEPTASATREQIVQAQIGAEERAQRTPLIWALDNLSRSRERAELLHRAQDSLQHDLAAKDALNQRLIAQLAEQITNLDQANLALQDAQRRLLTEREAERKALSRELHDQVIQDLVSLNYDLDEIISALNEPRRAAANVDELRQAVRQLVTTVRHICGELRPPTIDSMGIGAALQSFTSEWSGRAGVAVMLDITGPERLGPMLEITLFRIVQEALSNVRKHASASAVRIQLTPVADQQLRLVISDNGRGLPANNDLATLAAGGHYGLLGISERVALLGGHFWLHPTPLGGTTLEVEVPLSSG